MDDVDVETRVLDALLELVRADQPRTHPGFADEYDELHLVGALRDHDTPSLSTGRPVRPVGGLASMKEATRALESCSSSGFAGRGYRSPRPWPGRGAEASIRPRMRPPQRQRLRGIRRSAD